MSILEEKPLYERIYGIVNLIPRGRVATYGQIAAMAGRCTPRMAGYVMAALPAERDIPWHRVINAKGMVSPRSGDDSHGLQRVMLEAEGVVFDHRERVNLSVFGWRPGGQAD
jgi:methylated-DNA-protein-cysteine methyltransferase-like protein